MAKFKVKIVEKLVRTVLAEAETPQKAEQIVTAAYERSDIILDYRDFDGETLFSTTEIEDEKYNDLKDDGGLTVITESEEE